MYLTAFKRLCGLLFLLCSGLVYAGESLHSLDVNKSVRLDKLGWRAYKTSMLTEGMPLVVLESNLDKDLQGFYSKEFRTIGDKSQKSTQVLDVFCKQLDSLYKKNKVGLAKKVKIKKSNLCYVELLQNDQKVVQFLYPSNFNYKSAQYRVHSFTFTVNVKDFKSKIQNINKFVAEIMR